MCDNGLHVSLGAVGALGQVLFTTQRTGGSKALGGQTQRPIITIKAYQSFKQFELSEIIRGHTQLGG